MRRPLRTLQVAAIALSVAAVLFCVQSGSASYRRFRDFDLNSMYLGPVCTDGVAIGLKNEQEPDRLELRKLEIHTATASGDVLLGETQIVTTSYGLRDLVATDFEDPTFDHWNTFCHAFETDAVDKYNPTCGGPFYVEWDPPMAIGTVVDVYFYAYVGGVWEAVSRAAGNPLRIEVENRTVEDCRVHDLRIELVQSVSTVKAAQASTSLLFGVSAYDYSWPNLASGDGIAFVTLEIVDFAGNTVSKTTDTEAPYCAFGNDALPACLVWNFAQHSDTWPSGQPLVAGTYRLRATVYGLSGSIQTREWPVDLTRSSNPTNGESTGEPSLLKLFLPGVSSQP